MDPKLIAVSIVYTLSKASDYLIFQQFEHFDKTGEKFFWSKENIDALAAAKCKVICIELSPKVQTLTDKVAAGKITPEQYADKLMEIVGGVTGANDKDSLELWANQGRGIRYAAKKGFRIGCVDVVWGKDPIDGIMFFYLQAKDNNQPEITVADLREHIKKRINGADNYKTRSKEEWQQILDKLDSLGLNDDVKVVSDEFYKSFEEEFNHKRIIDGDPKVAEAIQKFAKGERTVVKYGIMHGATAVGDTSKDLDEHLAENGRKTVNKIGVLSDWPIYARYMNDSLQEYPVTCIFTKDDKPKAEQLDYTSKSNFLGAEIRTDEIVKDGVAEMHFNDITEKVLKVIPPNLQYHPEKTVRAK